MKLKKLLDIASAVLLFSAAMDVLLWILIEYMIPCWTISAVGIADIAVFQVLKRLLPEK